LRIPGISFKNAGSALKIRLIRRDGAITNSRPNDASATTVGQHYCQICIRRPAFFKKRGKSNIERLTLPNPIVAVNDRENRAESRKVKINEKKSCVLTGALVFLDSKLGFAFATKLKSPLFYQVRSSMVF
jgi:hypothetical protein